VVVMVYSSNFIYIINRQIWVNNLLLNFVPIMQREEVRNMIERDGSAKGIVFSQFTSFLDLIQFSLEKVKSQKTFSGLFAAMFIHY
jgi:SNF2 family DNA or RNA helicase